MTYIDEMVKELCPNGVEWKELGEVAAYSKQRVDVSGLDISNYTGVENLLQNRGGRENATSVPQTGSMIVYNCGDVLIGNIRPYLKKVWLSDRDGGTNGDVLVLKPDPGIILSRYLYYLISSDDFFHYNMQNAKGSKMPRGDKNKILAYKFQVPPLEIQEEIVKILDKFTDYVTELTAELTFRQKQYSYFRDKLLSFDDESMGGRTIRFTPSSGKHWGRWRILGEGLSLSLTQICRSMVEKMPNHLFKL